MTTTTTTLLLIDVQNDFHPGGSLAIPTANDDADRIASLIASHKIDRIVATLDSHQKLHIAHPHFWRNEKDERPTPFTIISADDIEKGVWKPREALQLNLNESLDQAVFGDVSGVLKGDTLDLPKYCLEYAKRLEAKGRFQICIWPEHCLIGSPGHAIVENVRAAISDWSAQTGGSVEWVMKGENLLTEMYSALAADVPVNAATAFNQPLFDSLILQSDKLLVCGQAMSHCVNYTARDIVDHATPEQCKKIYLLTDCASPVPGFEAAADTFQKDMKEKGVHLITSDKVAEIL